MAFEWYKCYFSCPFKLYLSINADIRWTIEVFRKPPHCTIISQLFFLKHCTKLGKMATCSLYYCLLKFVELYKVFFRSLSLPLQYEQTANKEKEDSTTTPKRRQTSCRECWRRPFSGSLTFPLCKTRPPPTISPQWGPTVVSLKPIAC